MGGRRDPWRKPGGQKAAYVRHHGGENVVLTGVTLGKETEKAILVTIEGVDYWMPLSQVTSMKRTDKKGEDEIVVSAWIAKEKGLR